MTSIQDIHKSARVGEGSMLGSFCVIEKDVQIGKDCQIGHHVVIHQGSRIGDNVRIDAHSVIGKSPMRAMRSIFQKTEDLSPAKIGEGCMIGAQVVIYKGCDLGSHCLVADGAAVRENVQIGEYTIIGRLVTVENYSRVGKKCKLETGSYITAYSELGDYCFIAPHVTTTNDNYLGRTEERFKQQLSIFGVPLPAEAKAVGDSWDWDQTVRLDFADMAVHSVCTVEKVSNDSVELAVSSTTKVAKTAPGVTVALDPANKNTGRAVIDRANAAVSSGSSTSSISMTASVQGQTLSSRTSGSGTLTVKREPPK